MSLTHCFDEIGYARSNIRTVFDVLVEFTFYSLTLTGHRNPQEGRHHCLQETYSNNSGLMGWKLSHAPGAEYKSNNYLLDDGNEVIK